MTTINVSNLILTLQKKINTSTNEEDLLYYAKAIQQLRTGNVFNVNTIADLPNSQQNPGILAYVRSEELVYFSSPFGYVPIYDSTASVIFSWGWNCTGVLGTGTTVDSYSPIRECLATDWCRLSSGSNHIIAIKESGSLWGWGINTSAELGDGTVTSRSSPVRLDGLSSDWCFIDVRSGYQTAAIRTSGSLWSWGRNSCGQVGDGTTINRCSPVQERSSSTNWCTASAGKEHTAAIKTDGTLWTWGRNECGALGIGTTTDRCSPTRELSSDTTWCQVTSGCLHSAAIKSSGQLWSWGFGFTGRLGDGTTVSRSSPVREFCSATDWCQASAFSRHVAAIKTSGELWFWGNGSARGDGRGDGDTCSPVREFCSATDWCQASVGYAHTNAIKTTGQLWGWGDNLCGRVGFGVSPSGVCSPVREFCSATDWCLVSVGNRHSSGIRVISV